MAISSTERRTKNVQIFVEKDAVETSFAKWAQPGHFSRTLAKGPKTTTWIWNLHAVCSKNFDRLPLFLSSEVGNPSENLILVGKIFFF